MPSRDEAQTTYQKAHRINLDGTRHGTFAEIGAGQEVVRWFFHVGGAAGTVAKSISAYDMAVSDSLYGPSDRYVSRSRLMAMLDHEYRLLLRHLGEKRRADTAFFVFANTMAARSYTWRRPGHGWVGLRFQHEAAAEPSEVIIHVRMLDTDNVREQEAIGVLGVNLIHAAFYRADRVEDFLSSLTDTLSEGRVEIDMARFTGPRFHDVDNRMVSLELVEQELTQTAMFGPEGEPLQPGEVLYKRPVLIERGKFRPVTTVTLDLIERSKARFESELSEEDGEPVVLMEMSLRDLAQADRVDHEEFLASADVLGALGQTVMISRLAHHHAVSTWLRNYTPQPLRFVMGAPPWWPCSTRRTTTTWRVGCSSPWAASSTATCACSSIRIAKPKGRR